MNKITDPDLAWARDLPFKGYHNPDWLCITARKYKTSQHAQSLEAEADKEQRALRRAEKRAQQAAARLAEKVRVIEERATARAIREARERELREQISREQQELRERRAAAAREKELEAKRIALEQKAEARREARCVQSKEIRAKKAAYMKRYREKKKPALNPGSRWPIAVQYTWRGGKTQVFESLQECARVTGRDYSNLRKRLLAGGGRCFFLNSDKLEKL